MTTPRDGALRHLMVLELGDEGTQIVGKHLADMGATVFKLEPPGGAGSRHRGPYKGGIPDANGSIYFWAHNTSKKGAVIDLEDPFDRALLRGVASRADLVLEDFEPGYLDHIGLGYGELSRANPRLVLTSVTPFGQSGPWAHWKGGDIVSMAAGGAMNMLGYSDAPPLLPQGDISFHMGAAWAMIGSFAALSHRRLTGKGQHVDVSVQDAVALSVDGYDTAPYVYQGVVQRRQGLGDLIFTNDAKWMIPQALNVPPERWRKFREWLRSEGIGEEMWDMEPATMERSPAEYGAVVQLLAATRTSRELQALGSEFGFTWMSLNSPEDLIDDPQLMYRGFFREVEHPELGTSFVYGGPGPEWSEAPWAIRSRAPLLGEHNGEFRELLPD